MKAIDALRKAAESATTRIQSYKGHDQGPNMNARAVMAHGKPETPRPHKTTQGPIGGGAVDCNEGEEETDRFSKSAEGRMSFARPYRPREMVKLF